MNAMIDRCKAMCFLDSEKERLVFSLAYSFEQVLRRIQEMHEASKTEIGEDNTISIKVPEKQWNDLMGSFTISSLFNR